MKHFKRVLMCSLVLFALTGCGNSGGKRIVRIGHNQSSDHPTHLALVEFEK